MTFTPGHQGRGHRSLCTWLSEQNLSSASACQHLYHLSLGNCGGIKFRLPELWLFLFLALKGISVLHNRFPCIAPGHCLLSIESDKIGVPFHCWSVLQRSHGLTKRPRPDWRLVRTLACLEGRTLSCHRIATFSFDKVSRPPPQNCVAGTALVGILSAYYPSFLVTFQLFSYCLCEFLKPSIPSLKQPMLSHTDFSH